MPSQQCDVKGEGLGMVANGHPDLDLSVYARKETAIYIIYGERVSAFCDQCVLFNKSRVYKIPHGARVDHGCCLDHIRQSNRSG